MSLVLDEHRHYLADRPRIAAFRAALRSVVRPGDVVLDLACGSGVLGFLACEAGARRVYAVDEGPILGVARQFAHANGYADRVTFIRELSTRTTLPERVDVVVCDQVGNLGIEAGVFEYLLDASRRFLKPGGRALPSAVTFRVAAVEHRELRERIAFWTTRPGGLEVSSARTIAINTGYPELIDPAWLLSPPATLATAQLPPRDLSPIRGAAHCDIQRAGTLDGIGAWFVADLAPGITMSNGPDRRDRIDRRNVLLPVDPPVAVEPGDRVGVEINMLAPDAMVNWTVTITRGGARVYTSAHSTFRGMLISAEDLARTAPGSRPALTAAGAARRSVLELCDGRRPLRDIEDEVYARHPELFPSRGDAGAFVAEVVTRYCVADAPLPTRQPAAG